MDKILLGGLIGFGAAVGQYFITSFFQNRKEKKKFYREKLEDIFTLTDKTQHTIYSSRTNMLNKDIKSTGKFDDSNSKLAMLIQYYTPNIEKEFQEYLKVWANVGQYLVSDIIGQELKQDEFIQQMQNYDKAYIKFKKSIREEAQKYI